jgi:hypothetical protein
VETHYDLKMAVSWDTPPCSLVEVDRAPEVLTASIVRALSKPGREQLGYVQKLGLTTGRGGGKGGGTEPKNVVRKKYLAGNMFVCESM